MAVHCRVCGRDVQKFLDLGRQPLSDAFVVTTKEEEYSYLLHVGVCESCSMVQLLDEIPREKMFNANYPYFSSGSAFISRHFQETADELAAQLTGINDPLVVEIGCNDGVFLGRIAELGIRHLGFEPSNSVAEIARARGIDVVVEFFEQRTAQVTKADRGSASLIYAANTFCHVPYIDSILAGVKELLTLDGVFIFEDPYLGDIVEKVSYDQIYDEHYFYFSATSIRNAAAIFGLELVDVQPIPVHGGEIRYTLAHSGSRVVSAAVDALIEKESLTQLHSINRLQQFAAAVKERSGQLVETLQSLRSQGLNIAGYGATAKSATVLNFAGIGPDLITCIYDSTPAKQGKLTPLSHIPVKPADSFAADSPDVAVLFAWNHAEEILTRETDFHAGGGQWLVYVPSVAVVN